MFPLPLVDDDETIVGVLPASAVVVLGRTGAREPTSERSAAQGVEGPLQNSQSVAVGIVQFLEAVTGYGNVQERTNTACLPLYGTLHLTPCFLFDLRLLLF